MNDVELLSKPAVVVVVREAAKPQQPIVNAPRFDYEAGPAINPKLVMVFVMLGMTIMVVVFCSVYRGGLPWSAAEAIRSVKAIF